MSTLSITKDFTCSKQDLYRAWTEPEQLKSWWKPMGKQLVEVENDLKEGGAVKYTFEGESLAIEGDYKKVEPAEMLEYSWNWHLSLEPVQDAEYVLKVKFSGDEENASINIEQDGFKNEESIQPHREGWEQGLEQLGEYLRK